MNNYKEFIDILGNIMVLPEDIEVKARQAIDDFLEKTGVKVEFAEVYYKMCLNHDEIIHHAITSGYDCVEDMVLEAITKQEAK